MSEQEKNEIVLSVKSQFTDDLADNLALLEKEIIKYSRKEEDKAVAQELLQIAYSLVPQNQREYLQKVLYINDRRIDRIYAEANRLIRNREYGKSLELTEQLYHHVLEHFKESDTTRFFSFRNLLESNLYYQLYHPTKSNIKAPFDFTLYLGAHAYNLVELKRTEEAIPVLEEAIRYNPVNPDPRFELAEAYKLLGKHKELLTTIRETHPICTSKAAIGRCYTNMGFYCVEVQDFDSAVCFYYESMVFEDHPAIPGELRHIGQLTGKKIIRPTREEVKAAFEKYEITLGPGAEALHTASSLAAQAMEKENWAEAVFYLRVVYDLTNDPKAAEDLMECQDKFEKMQRKKK